MKKINLLVLVGLFILCINMVVSAADIKLSGTVDALIIENEKELGNPAIQNALLKVNAKISDAVDAQLSTNLLGKKSGEENIKAAENFVSAKLGGVTLKAGSMLMLSLKERNTLFNNNYTANNFFTASMSQVSLGGKASIVSYDLAFSGGQIDGKGKPSNDLSVKVSLVPVDKLSIDIYSYIDLAPKTYAAAVASEDMNDDGDYLDPHDVAGSVADEDMDSKQGLIGVGVSYEVAGVSIDAQVLSFEKVNDITDVTKEVSNEIIVGVGYKIADVASVGLSYDMLGKANNVVLKGSYELAKGAKLNLRADMPNKDYKADGTIGLGLGTEF